MTPAAIKTTLRLLAVMDYAKGIFEDDESWDPAVFFDGLESNSTVFVLTLEADPADQSLLEDSVFSSPSFMKFYLACLAFLGL